MSQFNDSDDDKALDEKGVTKSRAVIWGSRVTELIDTIEKSTKELKKMLKEKQEGQ